MKNKRLHFVLYFLLFAFYFLFLVLVSACGRRGDPVVIAPHSKAGIEKDLNENGRKAKDSNVISREGGKSNTEKIEAVPPNAPTGLVGVYTQKSIVLTWDEVTGQDVRLYRIYRSMGNGYILVGYTATPAFTDKDVEPQAKYYYRVTTVGESESPPSKEIEIVTEIH